MSSTAVLSSLSLRFHQAVATLHGGVILLLSLLVLEPVSTLTLEAQEVMSESYKQYIRTYADESIRQMHRHRIPASITMAQGLVETGGGASRLAREGNNHFGIKCHSAWSGMRIYADDDARGECFRRYESPFDSYTDHSLFLKQPRYRSLFSYDITDYVSWARGLQLCGYATNKGYANMLIRIIELYGLYELDAGRYPQWMTGDVGKERARPNKYSAPASLPITHEGYFSYGLLYIIARKGDTLEGLAREMDIKLSRLADYNDMPTDFPLREGDIIYLDRKNRRATADYPDHVVRVGESMHSISQLYGIRLAQLYKMNGLSYEYIPEEGDVLRLR